MADTTWMSEVPSDEFAEALTATREAVGISQATLAKVLGRSVRTLVRWENGDGMPREYVRESLVGWLRTIRSPHAEHALKALGVLVPAPPAPPTPKATLSAARAHELTTALERALHAAAEKHDVPAGRARSIVTAVLESIEAAGVDVRDARRLLAPT